MGQGQGKGLYSQVGAPIDDEIDQPESFIQAVKTQSQQHVLRAKAALGQDLDIATNNNETDGANFFVFGTDGGDSSHRVVHDSEIEIKRSLKDELAWRIFVEGDDAKERKLILIRMSFDRFHLPEQFSQAGLEILDCHMKILLGFRSGDILEYIVHGELRWALWNREEIIFWENGVIEKRAHRTFTHPCRKLPIIIPPNEEGPSPTDIYINATNKNSGLDFSNSQAWASWCVTKNQNFAAISTEIIHYLELPDLGISERFSSLDSLMCKKVEYEQMGFDEVQKYFGVKQNLRGIVRCVQ